MSGALIVFAKRPEPGRVKTRMSPPFTPRQAADFYAAMLEDVLVASEGFARESRLEAVLALDPPGAVSEWAARWPGFRVVAQRGADLSARMENASAEAFAAGHHPVLMRGSDSPMMTAAAVRQACTALEARDLVFCPDLDGGYNLVGLARAAPGIFDHPMSTGSVLADTQARARAQGLTYETLPAGFDVDSAADLELLRRSREEGKPHHCSRTIQFLDRHGLWVDADGNDA